MKAISITGTRRIVKYAFDYARKHGRKKVTSVHKANILKYSDGLFLEVSREVAKEYPDIEFEDRIVDNMCMQLVQKPELYDVLVLPNLYGDIVSDLCAGLVGGLGVAPGANIGEAGAVFEATHGSAPKYKGQYKMNPTALILSGVLMLEHLGETQAAQRLENAVARVIEEGKDVTYDMKPHRDDPDGRGYARDGQGDHPGHGSRGLSRLLDQDAYLNLIRGRTGGPLAHLARWSLRCAAIPYSAVVALRNRGFDRGWLEIQRADVPVISVGNLTVGGTGKTPMVEWVARWFRRRGKRVAILSRGYKQVRGLNDEGRVLEENLPDVPHLQDRNRGRSARIAVDELDAEVLVLDDGFQHRRLARDLDLVMIDALEPFGLGHLLPRGLLREPLGSLRRADLVILSRSDLVTASERKGIRTEAERRSGPLNWVEARHAPIDLIDAEGTTTPISEIVDRSVAAFCGIGNPEGFRRTLSPLFSELRDFRIFPDHYDYTAADVESLQGWARHTEANLVLTTQKDLVKLRRAAWGRFPCERSESASRSPRVKTSWKTLWPGS